MSLTGRQKIFLSEFMDLYYTTRAPIHYATVAEELGVSKITAYDMMRLLEERGLLTSEYILPKENRGPGRSAIVFRPTEKASVLLAELAGGGLEMREWKEAKARIFEALRERKGAGYQDLLEEILLRVPERKSPMLYSMDVITSVLLSVQLLGMKAGSCLDKLSALGLPGEAGLRALTGIVLGLTFVERVNRRLATLLLSYAEKYQRCLSTLGDESKGALSEFTQEAIRIVIG